jgi:nitrate/nitrite-specific signal transduction histidine kinase
MSAHRRWWLVFIPVIGIGVVEILSDSVLDPQLPFPFDTLVVMAVIAAASVLAARLVFDRLDRLTAALQARNRELEARAASSRALHHVSVALAALADVDAILQAVVDNARLLLRSDVALLVLVGPDGAARLVARSGPDDAFTGLEAAPAESLYAGSAPDFRPFVREATATSHLVAPLQRGGRTIGTLAVASAREQGHGVDAIESLSSLAIQAAVALENARLQAELREMAIRGERERIAREMHDGLAQVLGYVNAKSQAVEELLAVGRVDDARGQLAQLATAARSVYVDVREAILGLTSPMAPERGLVGALEEYAARFSDASKIAVAVDASAEARALELAPHVQAQVFRIVQEALTNVRKHADAQRTAIHLSLEPGVLRVAVEDDGQGMSTTAAPSDGWPHFGMRTMRERAAELAGQLEVGPAPTGGTCLELRLPLDAVGEPA